MNLKEIIETEDIKDVVKHTVPLSSMLGGMACAYATYDFEPRYISTLFQVITALGAVGTYRNVVSMIKEHKAYKTNNGLVNQKDYDYNEIIEMPSASVYYTEE